MRIAILVPTFPLVSETFIVRRITGLMDLGHEVDIFSAFRPPNGIPIHPEVTQYGLLERTTYLHIPHESGYWEMPITPLTGRTWVPDTEEWIPNSMRLLRALPVLAEAAVRSPRLTHHVLDPDQYGCQARSLSSLYRLERLSAQRKRYDLVQAHFGGFANSYRFLRSLWNAPYVASFHGRDYHEVPRKEGRDVYRRLFETADAVTTNSRYAMGRLEDLGCPTGKLHLIPPGLDLGKFPFKEKTLRPGEEVRVLTVARLVPIKGLAYSIRAFSETVARYPNARYDIVGEGPERAELERLIAQLGLESRVSLHGAKPHDVVRQMLDRAHLFVLPSINLDGTQESLGGSALEAQASGLPVIGSRTGGIPEALVEGRSGFLFPDRDVPALAAHLLFLMEHPELWPEMGRIGRRHVAENYDISRIVDRLEALYQSLVSRSTEAAPGQRSGVAA